VAVFSKLDWKASLLEMARESRANAQRVADPKLRQAWLSIAVEWERLARLQPENCFCGRPAIGMKRSEGGENIQFCGEHLAKAINESVLAHYAAKSSG
jgi:hypothetical protein